MLILCQTNPYLSCPSHVPPLPLSLMNLPPLYLIHYKLVYLNSVACGSFQRPAAMESEVLTFMMDHVMVCPVNTIAHVPRSVRPL